MNPEDNSLESGYHTSNDGFQDPGSTFNPNKGGGFNFLTFKLSHLAAIITLSTVILVCLFGGSALLYNHLHGTKTGTENSEASNGTFKVGSTISVQQTSPSQLLQLGQVNELAVNGQLTVSKSVVLTPSSEPSSPVAGEIYYDQTSNAPYYYNGSEFVSLLPTASPQSVTTLGGTAGVIGLGSGLSITGNKLDISSSFIQAVDAALSTPVVNSLQGLTGSVSFSGGAGIAISGTEVTNTGVVNLTSTNNSVNVTNEGNGTYNLSIPSGAGSVILAPSTAQADSSTNSSIFINKTGSGNTLELQNSGVDAFVVSQTGQITTGTINYSQVQGRPSTVVNSIGGSTGALTLGSGLGLNSNTLSNTGVTSIAGTPNQVIASGSSGAITLSLPQSIATSSSPTFDSQTLNGTLGVTDLSTLTGGVSTTTLNVSGTSTLQGAATADSTLNVQGVLTVGVPGSQGGNIYLSNSSSTNTVDLVGENPSGSGIGTIQFPTIVGGTTDTVCLESLANCGASSNTVTTSSSGTSGDIPKFTGGDTVANSSISDNGSTVTVAELLSASTISTTTIQSSGSLSINPGGTLSIGASNHTLSLTGSSSSTFAESANGFTDTLGFTAPTSSSHNITVPDATGTVCLENSPSCGFATGGSGVTSVDLLAGALSIADSTGTGSTITIQNASTTQAGIAEFDSSDFQSSGGVIDTIQGISSTSDVQFDSLALDNGGTCSAGGNLCLGNNGTVYADNYSNPSSSSNLVIDSGSTNVEFENQSGTNSFLFPTYGGTGQTICTSGITCASGGGQAVILGPSGVQDTSTNTTGIYIDKTGGTGNLLTLQTGSSQNALVIDSSGNATFSNTTTAATLDVSGTLQTETITPNASLTVGSSSQSFTLQGNESSEILGEASGNYTYLGFATPGGNSASSGTIYYALDNSAATNTQGTPYFVCTTAGNCSGAGGSVTALGGSSANYVPLFSSTLNPGGNIEDSIVTETGSNTINVLGSLNVGATGNGQLAVGVASTVNGTIVVNNSSNNKTVTINQAAAPSSNVTLSLPTTSGTFAVSASGPLVLNATTGVLSCPDCDSSGGGGMSAVQSLNGLAGAITINNASVSSQNIQLNYAKADGTTLGIAAFNATDFTDNGSGVIDTAQSIASTASPTFANLTLQGTTGLTIGSTSNDGAVTFLDGTNDGFSQKISQTTLTGSQTIDIPNASGTLAVSASGNLSLSALGNLTTVTNPTFSSSVTTPLLESAAALNITPGGTLTAGAANQTFTLQGNASSSITSTSGSYTSTLSFDSPTSNNAIYLPNQGGTICLSSNNCSYEASGSYILNQTTQQTSANIDIAGVASNVAAKIQGASGQNILNLYSSVSSSTPVAYFDSAGDLLVTTNDINGATITGGALSGGNVSGSSLSSTQLTFTGASGAIATTGATSLSLDTGGAASLNLGTTNATGIIIGSTSNTSSTSIIANTTLNLGNNANSKTINVGATGSTANTTALNLATSTGADQTVDIGGTGGSGTNSNSSTTITLQGGTTSESLTGSGETLTTYTNSTSAFEVQNSAGASLLNANTSGSVIDIDQLSAPGSITTMLAPAISSVTSNSGSGTNYTYEVTAVSASGAETLASAAVTVSGNSTLNSTSNYNIISWASVTGASLYKIYRTASSGNPSSVGLIGSTTSTSFNDTGYVASGTTPALASSGSLSTSTTYYYEVTALDSSGGQSTPSAQVSQATTSSYNTITLSWAPVSGARAYDVYRTSTSSNYTTDSYYTVATNSFSDTGAAATGTNTAPPSTATAYNDVLSTSNNSQVTIGATSGSPSTAQLDVAGSIYSNALGTVNGVNSGLMPLVTQGNYTYMVNDDYVNGYLQIIDTSNPNNPTTVSADSLNLLNGDFYYAEGEAVQANYLYVTGSYGDFAIYNISNPTAPIETAHIGAGGVANKDITVSGKYAYISTTNNTLTVVDISNPYDPVVLPAQPSVNGRSILTVSGNYLYAADGSMQIYSLSNPASPTLITSVGGNVSWISVVGRYAYTVGNSTLQIFDISNPANPVLVGSASTGGGSDNIAVEGNDAYVLNSGNSTLQTFNVANPSDPISLGTGITVGSGPTGLTVQGNYAYVNSSGANTFQVYNIGGTYTQSIQSGSMETTSLQVDGNANLGGNASIDSNLAVGGNTLLDSNLGVGGSVTFANQSNSTSALQVQNSSSTTLLNVDTTNSRIGAGQLATPGTPTATLASGGSLATGNTYYFEITALDSAGGQTAVSGEGTGSGATSSGNQEYSVSWGAVTGAVGYRIYYSTSSGTESHYYTSTTNSYTFTAASGTSATPPTTGYAYVNELAASVSGINHLTNTVVQTATNASTALEVQNASGANLFQVDTSGNNIYLGGTTNSTEDIGAVGSAAYTSTINIGTSTGAAQTVTIGSTNSSSSLTLQAGGGITANTNITQSVSSGSSTGTISLLGQSATNANTGLVSTTVNADSITLIGTNNTNVGENILNGLSFNNVTATTNNTVNGLYFGSGYTNGLDFSSASGFTSFITAPSFNLNTSGGLSLGTIGSAQGSLTLNSSHSGGSFTFQPSSSQSAAINLTIPTDGSSDTICLVTLANCSGSSGGSGDTSYIFNQTTQQSSANIDIDSSSSAVAAKIQGASGQNILNLYGSSSSTTPVDYFDGSGDLTVTQSLQAGSTSLSTLQVASSASLGTATSATGSLVLYDSSNSNTVTLNAGTTTGSYSLNLPTAGPSSTGQCLGDPSATNQLGYVNCVSGSDSSNIILTAEYAGAALDAASDSSCSSASVGTMTSGFSGSGATPEQNYYEWTTSQSSNQCYDVVVQVPLPSDFGSFPTSGTTLKIYGTNSSGTNSTAVAVEAIQCNGSADSNFGGGYVGISTGTSWGQTSVSGSSDYLTTANYTSCGYLTLKIRMTAANSSTTQIGSIDIPYTTSSTSN